MSLFALVDVMSKRSYAQIDTEILAGLDTSDGLVVERFPKTDKGRVEAEKTLKRHQK